ncbi:phosphonate C-P lyase system protein PhnH [Crenobacter sp. SG2305]|uniref:phosphonate C-P lyase system protein PhnH n=1 Tax=Crenobacter oryzisoli TaxID=3056844 RepID=UPI0025AB235A|nr:phosphonate C-P lyase system protein PhnH [Crenobacter sp. SG2305]MDN0082852.1 phosphonate C-P lyase system protein PhnH [Crenobacter sp. SG2305]
MMLLPQFDKPVHDAQRTFRTVLAALAEPLAPLTLPVLPPAPDGLLPGTAAVLLTLLDQEVSLYADPLPADAGDWLRFHTGVRLADSAADADFVLVRDGETVPHLAALKAGEAAYPDRSATVIVETARFGADQVEGCGPGFAAPRRFGASALPAAFWVDWKVNHARFPLGVDLLLVSAGAVAGLPRTTQVTEI